MSDQPNNQPTNKTNNQPTNKTKKKNKRKKCIVCKKKSLTNVKCRCEVWTCLTHMHTHDCKFDWYKYNQELLKKQLIKVEPKKISVI